MDTLRARTKKREIDDRMKQLDRAITNFSNKRVFVSV